MTTKLIDLENRIITDTGQVIAKPNLLVKKVLSDQVFTDMMTLDGSDIQLYNQKVSDDKKISIWYDDGDVEGPSKETFEWNIPDAYKNMTLGILEDILMDELMARDLIDETYSERLEDELEKVEDHNMLPFIQCLVFIIDTFKENDVVWGIGRGSSCASLIMFLLDVNKVDPVKYDIPMEEFYK